MAAAAVALAAAVAVAGAVRCCEKEKRGCGVSLCIDLVQKV